MKRNKYQDFIQDFWLGGSWPVLQWSVENEGDLRYPLHDFWEFSISDVDFSKIFNIVQSTSLPTYYYYVTGVRPWGYPCSHIPVWNTEYLHIIKIKKHIVLSYSLSNNNFVHLNMYYLALWPSLNLFQLLLVFLLVLRALLISSQVAYHQTHICSLVSIAIGWSKKFVLYFSTNVYSWHTLAILCTMYFSKCIKHYVS